MALRSALWEATTGSMWSPEANRVLSMALRSEGSDMASTRNFGSRVAMGSTVNWSASRCGTSLSTWGETSMLRTSICGTPVCWLRKSMRTSSEM